MLSRTLSLRISTLIQPFTRRCPKLGPSCMLPKVYPMFQYGCFATLKQSNDSADDEKNIMSEENNQVWKTDFTSVIPSYPFHHIPVAIVRNPSIFEMDQSLKKDLIAFKALNLKGNDVELASKLILTPDQQASLEGQEQLRKGQQVFDLYFEDKIEGLIQMLNQGSKSYKERLNAIIILNYISQYFMEESTDLKLNESSIIKQDKDGVLLAYYVRFATKFDQDYLHLIPLLYQKLEGDNKPEHKLQISKILFSAYFYTKYYPQKMIDLAIQSFIDHIPTLHNYELIFSMKVLYNYQSPTARKYGEALIDHIKSKHIEEGNIDFHVPMILKTIRYCNKHQLSCDDLVDFIVKNMKRFKIIFEKKNLSKGLLFSLIFEKSRANTSSEEVLSFLKQFFFDTLKEISVSDQIQEGQLIRVSKLLIKYFDKLSEGQKQHVRSEYFRYIIPQFNHSDEVLLYSILVVLREPRTKPEEANFLAKFNRDTELVKKSIIQYLQNSSQKEGSTYVIKNHINSAIQLMYQIKRHDLDIPKTQLPSLLGYNFAQKKSLDPYTIGYFFSYLTHCHQKPETIRRVLDEIEPLLQTFFRKKKIHSIQSVYSILNICNKTDYEHKYLFKHIQNFIADFLITHPNYFIADKDIKFINDKLIKRGYGSRNIKFLIEGVLQNPKNWPKYREEYISKQKAFKSRLETSRNNRK